MESGFRVSIDLSKKINRFMSYEFNLYFSVSFKFRDFGVLCSMEYSFKVFEFGYGDEFNEEGV